MTTGSVAPSLRGDRLVVGASFVALVTASLCVGIDSYTDEAPVARAAVPLAVIAEQSRVELAAADYNRDRQCLAEAMYHEARSEGAEGQKAVAEVIFHRVRSRLYPNSVCDVVYEGLDRGDQLCQFSYACNGSLDKPVEPEAWSRSYALASRILSGVERLGDTTGRAIAYHTVDVSPEWAPRMLRTAQVGNHVFYRFAPVIQVAENAEETRPRSGALMADGSIVPYDVTLLPASSLEIKTDIEVDSAVRESAGGDVVDAALSDASHGL